MIVLATVSHSATHLAFYLFQKHWNRQNIEEDLKVDNPFWFGHANGHSMPYFRKRIPEGVLVSTMRHPMKVAEGWIKRSRVIDDTFCDQWRNLFALHDEFDGYFLPVDTDDRDERLAALSDRIGVELTTSWQKEGEYGGHYEYRDGMTLDDAREFLQQYRDRFAAFGYEI